MGCTMSNHVLLKKNGTTIQVENTRHKLTEKQREMLRESWEVFQPKKTAIGRKMFVNLFKIYPEMQNFFPEFRGVGNIEDLEQAKFLNGHSKRLMTAVENAVLSMGDQESFTMYLHELGRRHIARKLKPHYLERMGAAMMLALKESYPDMWNLDLEEAWHLLYKYISDMMIHGLNSP